MQTRSVIYVAPDTSMHGGMASVGRVLAETGFFARENSPQSSLHVEFHASVLPGSRWSRLTSTGGQLWRFARRPRARDTVVHLNTASRVSFLRKAIYLVIAKWKGYSIVLQIHPEAFVEFYYDQISATRSVIRWIIRRAHRIVALTERVRLFVETDIGAPCAVIANPVGIPDSRPFDRDYSGLPIVLFAGDYTEAKGVHTLVRSAARLRAAGFRFRLKMFGQGAIADLRTLVAAQGLEPLVSVDGWIEPGPLSAEMARAHMLVLPSTTEGLPMVVLEAMAHGLPVVVTSVGALPALVQEGVNGLLVPPGDDERLAAAVAKLISDRTLAQAMGAANEAKVAEFAPDRIIAALRTIYDAASQIRSNGKAR